MHRGDETAEWLNQMFARFWLIFEPVVSEGILASVNPLLEYYTPSFIVREIRLILTDLVGFVCVDRVHSGHHRAPIHWHARILTH
jgi:hypothetical protein